jgi:hypothetical protein
MTPPAPPTNRTRLQRTADTVVMLLSRLVILLTLLFCHLVELLAWLGYIQILDRISGFLWREHPLYLAGVKVEFIFESMDLGVLFLLMLSAIIGVYLISRDWS